MDRQQPMRRMTINLFMLCCALAVGALSGPAFAQQKYPVRTIRIVAPFPAAGAADSVVCRRAFPVIAFHVDLASSHC